MTTQELVRRPDGILPRADVSAFDFDGGMVLLDPRANRLFAYNDSAALGWLALQRTGGLDGASQTIADAYGIPRELAARDFSAILDQWLSLGLLAGAAPVTVESRTTESLQAATLDTSAGGTILRESYRLKGCEFDVVIEDDDVANRTRTLLHPYRIPAANGPCAIEIRKNDTGELVLTCDGAETLRANSSAEMTGGLFQTLLSRIHSYDRWLAIVHGGAVALNNRALLLPGSSGSGKSTLGAFLVARGFDYLSDDMIAVTRAGDIAAWPIPISLKEGSWSALASYLPELAAQPSHQVWVRTVKYLPVPTASWDAPHCPARVFVFPKFEKGKKETRLTPLTPLEALQRLLSDRIWLGYPLQAQAIQEFLDWLARMRCYELTYGSFDSVEELLRAALERDDG